MLSSVVLAAAGLAYFAAPGLALGIVGLESTRESEFLLRTEGVALLFGGYRLSRSRSTVARPARQATRPRRTLGLLGPPG